MGGMYYTTEHNPQLLLFLLIILASALSAVEPHSSERAVERGLWSLVFGSIFQPLEEQNSDHLALTLPDARVKYF